MLNTLRRAEYAELIVLFFLQGAALGMWWVPLSSVLAAHGLASIRPWAFATSGVAAFVSPLLFGAVADRHASPVKVLRWLALATAIALAFVTAALRAGAPAALVLALIQLHAFCSTPTWSITSTIVLARLTDAKKEFGPIRALATIGWMAGCLLISALGADQSSLAIASSGAAWLLVCGMTFWLPVLETPKTAEGLTWTQRLGLDALTLLRQRDHRVMFLTTSLFIIPLAAFYPYAPPQLQALGFARTSAWMSIAQITEVASMLVLGSLLLRWRLKWIVALGLAIGVARFALFAVGAPWSVLAGVFGHGGSFTLVFITAQIYLDQRVDPAWRGRAQALMTLMNGGVGNVLGYLGTGAWFAACASGGATQWPLFWSVLTAVIVGVLVFFLATYRGRGVEALRRESEAAAVT